jgi:hypothetical protein
MAGRIRIERSHPDNLFSEDDNVEGVNLLESAREFDRRVCEWVEVTFPGADVALHWDADVIEGFEADQGVESIIADIKDNVMEDGGWWVEGENDE